MKPLFWIDLEMTGLDENSHHILEVAVVLTDLDLNPIEQFQRIVYQPPEVVFGMNDWCKKHHGESGLTAEIPNGIPLATVESEMISLVDKHYKKNDQIVLCGNSVGNDRRFIDRYLPEFSKRLHYRLIDVSSFKEIFREKYKISFQKKNAHRAVGDIFESIRELKHYLSFVKIPETITEGSPQTETVS